MAEGGQAEVRQWISFDRHQHHRTVATRQSDAVSLSKLINKSQERICLPQASDTDANADVDRQTEQRALDTSSPEVSGALVPQHLDKE